MIRSAENLYVYECFRARTGWAGWSKKCTKLKETIPVLYSEEYAQYKIYEGSKEASSRGEYHPENDRHTVLCCPCFSPGSARRHYTVQYTFSTEVYELC